MAYLKVLQRIGRLEETETYKGDSSGRGAADEAKAIRAYTDADDVLGQIADLLKNSRNIFGDTFTQIIPFGDFYKKDKAVEIIRKEVADSITEKEDA